MVFYKTLLYPFVLICLVACSSNTKKIISNTELDASKNYTMILLAGQSNMVGLGDIDFLKTTKLPDNIHYFNYGYDTQLNLMDYTFGPEIGLARVLNNTYPNQEFIIIKYAIGGSSLYDWHPNYNKSNAKLTKHSYYNSLYAKFINTVDSLTFNYKTKPMAFIWMQGETDATSQEAAKEYYNNFKTLIRALRDDFNTSDLPIILGRINPPKDTHLFDEIVRKAQEKITNTISNTYLIKTDNLPKLKDELHYNSRANLDLGKLFGIKLIEIKK